VIRTIVGYHPDGDGDWVAELSCYHNQYIRHPTPFHRREWVLDPAGRSAHVGSSIDCPLCDRTEFPEGLAILGRAGPWNQNSLPVALLRAHRTPQGQWGLLRVHDGAVDFQFESSETPSASPMRLEAGSHQPIPPDAPHRVILIGAVELELEFWGPRP
jgi:tellurite resistance-related uncharacterized protein